MTMRAIVGSVGGGKSYYLCKNIVEALVERDSDGEFRNRNIVTNLELADIGDWHSHMAEKHLEWYEQTELDHRLTVIGDDQLKEFWRYRGMDEQGEPIILPRFEKESYKIEKPDWSELASHDNGVHYILDEVGRELNARNWREVGFMIFEYATLHRHLGDDITWAAQVFKHVDSQFRSLAGEFLYMRNRSKEKWGLFNNYKDFKVYATSEPYHGSKGADSSEIMWQDRYRLDTEIASLYKTSKYGKSADTKVARRGLSMRWFWIIAIAALIAILIAVWVIPDMLIGAALGTTERDDVDGGEEKDDAGEIVVDPVRLPSADRGVPATMSGADGRRFRENRVAEDERALVARLIEVRHARPEEIADGLGDKFGVDAAAGLSPGSVFLTGEKSKLDQVAAMIALSDEGARPTVYVSAVLATVSLTDGEAFSLDWVLEVAKGGAQVEFVSAILQSLEGVGTYALDARDFGAVVRSAARSERFSVLSRPFVAVESGRLARLAAGREIPITDTVRDIGAVTTVTKFKEAELVFELSPVVLGDGRISLKIEQTNTDILTVADENGVPALSTQSFSTTLTVDDGAVVALGGIAIDIREEKRRYPSFIRLPFFRDKATTETRQEFVLLARISTVPPSMEGRANPLVDPGAPENFHVEGERARRLFGRWKQRAAPAVTRERPKRRGFFSKGSR